MICENVQIKKRKVCLGDLSKKITLHLREIKAPDDSLDFDYDQTITKKKDIWAAIQTVSSQAGGVQIFDGVNLIGDATHLIYIKYISNITTQDLIEYQGNYYRILRIENFDENNEYLKLFCNKRGLTGNEVNKQ